MRVRKNPMTPLAAVVASLLAGAAGTVCLDAVHSLKYHRAGGTDSSLAWDLSAHLAYGAGTGTTFWLLSRIVLAASACWPTVSGAGKTALDRLARTGCDLEHEAWGSHLAAWEYPSCSPPKYGWRYGRCASRNRDLSRKRKRKRKRKEGNPWQSNKSSAVRKRYGRHLRRHQSA